MLPTTNLLKGLSERQVRENQEQFGKNVLAEKTKLLFIKELVESFFSPLILLLLGASLISFFLGDKTDFLIIFAIVIASGLISFVQHFKAEIAAKRLKSKVLLSATVIRDGIQKEIPFSHVTIGDIVLLSVGDIIPADMQLVDAKELSIDQSSMTGETYPVEKSVGNDEKKAAIFAGTHVVTGEGKGVVVAIGKQTQLGKLSEELIHKKPQTDFDRELSSFSILVVRLILILTIFVFLVNAIFHHSFFSSFLFAVALAVGLTPELMPVIITVSLATGALEMEKKEVIVKFLPSIQNLGAMNILCMDKTGTLTENAITLSSVEDAHGKSTENILYSARINSMFQSGFKNPLDNAILQATTMLHITDVKKIDEIPFDFERKKLSVIVKEKAKTLLFTKGSPHAILEDVSFFQQNGKMVKMAQHKRLELQKRAANLASNGFRIVGIAQKTVKEKQTYTPADETAMTFLGFLVFSDPVKKTVKQTLQQLTQLGIQPKILTGDNEIVTKKTCLDAGIPVENILTGTQIDTLTNTELAEKAIKTTIFANLTPQQKAHIIQAIKQTDNVVGYLGDGINDAPPLKAADVGISVNNGSDIAKDVADVILMRKSLSVLSQGVVEGRKTYVNSFKYILMSLSSNFGNMMSVAIASLLLPFLPLLPVQIILIDFLYDMSQITVPSDNVDASMLTTPKRWSMKFLKKFTFAFGPLSSAFDLLTFGILLFFLHADVNVFRTGWFVESFLTQTLVIFSIRTQLVPFFRSKPSMFLVISAILTILFGGFLVFSPIGGYFSFASLPPVFWIIVVLEIIFYITCVELTKLWFYKKNTI